MSVKVYYCQYMDDLCDYEEFYVDNKCYFKRSDARKRAARLAIYGYHAIICEMELAGRIKMEEDKSNDSRKKSKPGIKALPVLC